MTASLRDRLVVVTGGATRLGREIALAFGRLGADVAITYRQSELAASATVSELEALGRRATAVRCDLREAHEVASMTSAVSGALGPIEVLILNAAVFRRTPIDVVTEEDWDWHMDTNAKGAFLCAQRVGTSMRRRGSGAIVFVADVAGLRPWANYIPYSASKAAVLSIMQGLAIALAPEVRVNAVAPGPILPPVGAGAGALDAAAQRTLLKRPGRSQDVADAVVFLATADYVTGVTLPVDGGRHLA